MKRASLDAKTTIRRFTYAAGISLWDLVDGFLGTELDYLTNFRLHDVHFYIANKSRH
jgi:hypothetical protein